MSENSIAALVSILTYRRKKDSKPAGRRTTRTSPSSAARTPMSITARAMSCKWKASSSL